MVLREEQIGGQPPLPSVTLLIIPPSVEISHLVFLTFDDSSPLDRSPERLVPSLLQLPCDTTVSLPMRRFDECSVGLDRPVEVVFGDPSTVLVVVVDILHQLPETRVRVLNRLSEVRPVVVEVLIRRSFNDHSTFTLGEGRR